MTRISTYGQMSTSLASILRVQSEAYKAQMQTSTGLKSETFQGIGTDTGRLLDLENQLARSLEYVNQGEIVSSRISMMYDAAGNMVDLLSEYQSLLSSAISGNSADLNYQSQLLLDSFADLANTRLSGRYLFAGDMTDTMPVNVEDPPYAAQSYPSMANTDYYQGDNAAATFKASDSKTIDYGVTADEAGFEQAIRALSLGANASEDPVDEDALTEAYDLVNSAIDTLLVTQTKLSSASSAIDWELDVQIGMQVRLEALASDIQEVDVAEAMTRMETLQTQLEASYSAISRINEMNLLDFL